MKKLSKLLLALSFATFNNYISICSYSCILGWSLYRVSKVRYGDPTAKALGIKSTGLTIQVVYQKSKHKKKQVLSLGILSTYLHSILLTDVMKVYLLNLILTKTSQPAPDGTPASEDFFTGMPSKCAVGNILYSWNYAYNKSIWW